MILLGTLGWLFCGFLYFVCTRDSELQGEGTSMWDDRAELAESLLLGPFNWIIGVVMFILIRIGVV